MEFSVVIPVYNEKDSLPLLQSRLHKVMEKLGQEYEIIYVDDGSKDSSRKILEEIKKNYSRIKIISFKKNQGQSTALFAGFREAKGKWIITLDADLQNPPQEILTLLNWRAEYDFITGIREKRADNFLRKTSSYVAKFFRWLILKDYTRDTGCSLKVFRREIIEFLPFFKNFHRFFTFLVRNLGFKVQEVPVKHQRRRFGKSKYGIGQRVRAGLFDLLGVFWLKKRMIKPKDLL